MSANSLSTWPNLTMKSLFKYSNFIFLL